MLIATLIQNITSESGLAIGLVGSLLSGAVGCTWWIGRRLNKIESRFTAIDNRLEAIEVREADNFTMAQAEVLALRTAINNPHMQVPDPRDPSKTIQTTQ